MVPPGEQVLPSFIDGITVRADGTHLVPVMQLAEQVGLASLADEHLSVPTDKGSHAGAKITALVGGMIAGGDCIDDMALLRHGAMSTLFDGCYAPSTLGSFLRSFTFGHVRQLDAVASRVLLGLNQCTPLLAGLDERAIVDIDDSIIQVHGHQNSPARFALRGRDPQGGWGSGTPGSVA